MSIRHEALSLCTRHTVCWYRHRQASVEASQLVSLLVAHDATLSRGDAVQRGVAADSLLLFRSSCLEVPTS